MKQGCSAIDRQLTQQQTLVNKRTATYLMETIFFIKLNKNNVTIK